MQVKTKENRLFRITIDQGGTFADGVMVDDKQNISVSKTPTNVEEPAKSIMNCIILLAEKLKMPVQELLSKTTTVSVGTTLGTNAILEGKGAKCCLIHTRGFRDTFELGRNIPKEDIYNLKTPAPRVLIPRYLRFGVEERIQYDGKVVTPLNENDVMEAVKKARDNKVEIPVVCFLHSYINPSHEEKAAEIIKSEYPNVVISSRILRRWIEYDRLSTATLAAYIKPIFTRFIKDLQKQLEESNFKGTLLFGTAMGDVTTAELAQENPANVISSGVANGVMMGRFLAENADFKNIVSIDIGGTSADIGVLYNRMAMTTTDSLEGDHKNAVESMDITSIGAGGGSVAWIDKLGVLHVGPQSTGANPGPACYGKGGQLPTTTDADVVMGYIAPDYFLGGRIQLNPGLAEKAIKEKIGSPLGIDIVQAAYSIQSLTESNMGEQIFLSIVQKGYDPRDFVLIAGGGAGPVHTVAIGKKLGMKQVYIPKYAAVFAALGGIVADYGYMLNRFFYQRDDQLDFNKAKDLYSSLEKEAVEIFARQKIKPNEMLVLRGAEMRYFGQLRDISIMLPAKKVGEPINKNTIKDLVAAFHRRHKELYGWGDPSLPVTISILKLRGTAKSKSFNMPKLPLSAANPDSALKRQRKAYFKELGGFVETSCYDGNKMKPGYIIKGPAIIEETTTTVVIPPACKAVVDAYENYLVSLPSK